jgi:dihydrofolate synthase/folylpolyglutamate synthase
MISRASSFSARNGIEVSEPVSYEWRRVTYSEAIQFLRGLQMFGARFGLETARQLARAAGHPQDRLKFIHVAGTNGKGSTCAMLEAIYRATGLRVGLYTSPHLVSFRERIQVNREMIREDDVARLVAEAREWVKQLGPDAAVTFFEAVTVIALRYFAEQKCDVVIWETGLGGRLDATNIVTPLVSVITNVQFDHEQWLGDTLEKIAREKAGIIKARVPVVTAAQDSAVLNVIREIAAQQLAPLHAITAAELARVPARLALAGEHQRWNAALALRVVEILRGVFPVDDETLNDALETVKWDARFHVIQRGRQTLVLDGAHNSAGARALAQTLITHFPGKPLTLVLGVLADKNWRDVCHALAPLARRAIAVRVASDRATDAGQLAQASRDANAAAQVEVAASCSDALQAASEEELIVVTGSLYFVGEAIELLGLSAAPGERALNAWNAPTTQKQQ